ncbi:hypothetical protein [Rhizosaccharibacter radicis]|uniref:Methyltransferase domain-containing protein n=1 Tax=Rhizosaccharibacter radicis TaxID=2782605 RepID=A0ABT1VVH8_9PROT|nr:hypothetical protein [Acetobacteraceae bacterium KSS12]
MARFPHRLLQPEMMDDPDCSPDEFRRGLRDLEKVNRLTLAYRPTLEFLALAVRRMPAGIGRPNRPLRLLDVGGGFGDMLRVADRWAARRGIVLEMTSLDRSPAARLAGVAGAPTRQPIHWITADLFTFRPERPPDLVISSLFAHHLDDEAVMRFLFWMERHAAYGWFINDLHRHALPFHVFRWWSRLAGWHRFVQHDGPVSIGRGFTRADWEGLLRQCELSGVARIEWWMPFRWGVRRLRVPSR